MPSPLARQISPSSDLIILQFGPAITAGWRHFDIYLPAQLLARP
jgi:hypothetical protein